MNRWTSQDSDEIYNISRWGRGYFSINEKGNIQSTPHNTSNAGVDLRELIEELETRGISAPVLIRFNEMLGRRIAELSGAFQTASERYSFKGSYQPVVPIKVNQQKHVVEQLVEQGREFKLGLEAGSKPELLAAIAMTSSSDATIICNGYKDLEYIETALMSCRLGLNTIIICDRFDEIEHIARLAEERDLRGPIGVRVKLAARGAGRWAESGGEASKFGLSPMEIVRAVEYLREHDLLDQFRAIHFHIGSQITSIRSITTAAKEASRVFTDLCKMGAPLKYIDVGGGLAVDYDGSRTNFASSMNYSLDEYAADIVSEIAGACEEAEVPHPTILSESGRALVAHHSVLVFDVLGVNEHSIALSEPPQPTDDEHEVIADMRKFAADLTSKNVQETFHDLIEAREQVLSLFTLGYINLQQRAIADEVFWDGCRKIDAYIREMDYVSDDLKRLTKRLYDTYYCNFSVFQSIPDAWAVGSLFPIAPIQRLNEKPTRNAILADLTCDSDGKITSFIDLHDVKSRLPLHPMNRQPYYLGVFLVGAYQETLGDLHNLFGDTNVVHISTDANGAHRVEHVILGDSVADVLSYVEYDTKELVSRIRTLTETALREGRIGADEVKQFMRRYQLGLSGYTYLEGEDQLT